MADPYFFPPPAGAADSASDAYYSAAMREQPPPPPDQYYPVIDNTYAHAYVPGPDGLGIDPVIHQNGMQPIDPHQFYAPTSPSNLFEAAAFGNSLPDQYPKAYPTRRASVNYAAYSPENGGLESDSDNEGTWDGQRKHKRKKPSRASTKKIKPTQARPPFANDKPVIVNPDKSDFWFIQAKNCQSMNVGVRRCRACTRRKSGVGACRFIGVRVFREDVSGSYYDGEDPDYGFRDQLNLKPSAAGGTWHAQFLDEVRFSVGPSSLDLVNYVLDSIAPVFVRFLSQEIELEKKPSLLRIVPKDGEGSRALCDICGTSLFSGRYMCYYCGLEMCLDCYDDWNNLGGDDSNGKLTRSSLRFVFEFCAYGNRHQQTCLIPVSRMMPGDLPSIYESVLARAQTSVPPRLPATNPTIATDSPADSFVWDPKRIDYQDGELSLEQFRARWKEGLPMVIHGVGSKLKLDWSDKGFIQRSGPDQCLLVDGAGEVVESTVHGFFEGFATGTLKGKKENLKLKDWPTHGDLKDVCPDLFADFEQALPFPIHTRREGFLNMASMFPREFNPPDLGPKLYNAYGSSHTALGCGSTTLHQDITDAVNIMAYSIANGSREQLVNLPGLTDTDEAIGAVWDIFRAEDGPRIRKFILEREREDPVAYNNPYLKRERTKTGKVVAKTATDDPIHRQVFYLTDPELIVLRQRYGVVPFRIWQKPGDAVFIPAGCAHQVSNISSCVKAAVDFVSPENLPRCVDILQDTRNLAKVRKKEDVLQLKQVLYFAWLKASEMLAKGL